MKKFLAVFVCLCLALAFVSCRDPIEQGSGPGNQKTGVFNITSDTEFDQNVTNSTGLVLVDFFKGGCFNCLSVGNSFDELSEDPKYKGKVAFCKVRAFSSSSLSKSDWLARYGRVENAEKFFDDNNGKDAVISPIKIPTYNTEANVEMIGGTPNTTPTIVIYKDGVPKKGLYGMKDDGYPQYTEDIEPLIDSLM